MLLKNTISTKQRLVLLIFLLSSITFTGCTRTAGFVPEAHNEVVVDKSGTQTTAVPSISPPTNSPAVQTEPIIKTGFLIGTLCSVRIYDSTDESLLDKAFSRIAELEADISSNEMGTEIDRINKKAGISPVEVSEDAFNAIKAALEYAPLAEGGFDITIGPISNLWRIGFPDARVPEQYEIDDALQYVGYKDVEIDETKHTVFLLKSNMRLDLGAIAKGFIADEVAKVLADNGVQSAIIDLGGNILTMGSKVDGNPWIIGVQNPFDARGEHIGTMKVNSQSVVTSGIYERYISTEDDKYHYHHLLSPFDGYPFDNSLASVTVISSLSIDGDALTTCAFSCDVDKGLELIESLEGIEAIFVTKDKGVYITSGLKDNFRITNLDFTLMN